MLNIKRENECQSFRFEIHTGTSASWHQKANFLFFVFSPNSLYQMLCPLSSLWLTQNTMHVFLTNKNFCGPQQMSSKICGITRISARTSKPRCHLHFLAYRESSPRKIGVFGILKSQPTNTNTKKKKKTFITLVSH